MRLKIHAFISLLLVSAFVGLAAGMPFLELIKTIERGMGGILGFIAIIVGLGSIMGKMLEVSGGAETLAANLISAFGEKRSSWALMITGFIISIPVFFDVGFIILVPLAYALSIRTGLSTLHYAIPLLAGLAVTHAFIPPTPGPVAVSEILGAPIGWMIMLGLIVGIPTAILAGPVFGKYIGKKLMISPPDFVKEGYSPEKGSKGDFFWVLLVIALPLILIVIATVTNALVGDRESFWISLISFVGHPFSALTLSVLTASWFLGYRKGFNGKQILEFSDKSLAPAGLIILVTGAGGVFKEVLTESGVGEALANTMIAYQIAPLAMAYLLAAIVRITQGSATVAMVTSAGMMAPVIQGMSYSEPKIALIALAIASGSTILSHVNDSGFWLVSKLLGMTEKQTLKSWTMMETIISVSGFLMTILLWIII